MNSIIHNEELFFVATKCCLYYNKRILIIGNRDKPGGIQWELPGGRISQDDGDIPLLESLARELTEEIGDSFGVEKQEMEPFMVHKNYGKRISQGITPPFLFLSYFHQIELEPIIRLSHEHTDYYWISEEELDSERKWRKGFDTILRRAFNLSKNI